MLSKDVFFQRPKWHASTYTDCEKAKTCTSHQRDIKVSSQAFYKKNYKTFGPDSLAIIHLKLLKLRPHTLKIKKTLTAVINTSRAAPWLLRVAITFLTSLQQCQSTKKKKSVSKKLTVSKYLTIHSRYVLYVNFFYIHELQTCVCSICPLLILFMSFLFKERSASDCNYLKKLRIRHLILLLKDKNCFTHGGRKVWHLIQRRKGSLMWVQK